MEAGDDGARFWLMQRYRAGSCRFRPGELFLKYTSSDGRMSFATSRPVARLWRDGVLGRGKM